MRIDMNKQMNNLTKIKYQAGITFWSFLFTGGVFIFFLYIGALLVPVYTSDGAIGKALKDAVEGVPVQEIRKKEIIKSVDRKLYVDGVYEGPDLTESVEIAKTKEGTKITLKYRKEIPLFYNIGMHLDFNHEEIK